MKMFGLGVAALFLGGCAATRYEPPPQVAPQPQATTAEAVVEAANNDAAAPPSTEPPSTAPPNTTPAPPLLPRVTTFERYRPAERSVSDIRDQNAAAPRALDFDQRLDQAHDRVYAWTQGVVEATDHRFAVKDREPQPVPAAPFRVGLMLETLDRSGTMKFRLDGELDMDLRLPNTERRLRVFITSDNPDEAPRGTRRDSSSLSAGLRHELARYLDFDVGVRVNAPPVAFTSIKFSREIELGGISFYPFAKVFLESSDGFGASAAATFDHWSGRTLLRSSSFAKWTADGDHKDWTQSLIFARAHELIVPDRYGSYLNANDIGHGWGMRLQAGGEDSKKVTYYESGIFYRHGTNKRWLYWFVEPLVRWDRAYNWSADPGIRVGIDTLFWDLARPGRSR